MSTQLPGLSGRSGCAWGAPAVRIVFGVIWGIDAWLKWLPGFRATFLPNLIATAAAEPHWLSPWFDFVLRLARPAPGAWVYLSAVIETVIAIALIAGTGRRALYIGGALWSLLIWATAEGFGAPYSRGATDIGTAVIYALVFCALLVMLEHGLDRRFVLDGALVRRLPRWSLLAGPVGERHRGNMNLDEYPS